MPPEALGVAAAGGDTAPTSGDTAMKSGGMDRESGGTGAEGGGTAPERRGVAREGGDMARQSGGGVTAGRGTAPADGRMEADAAAGGEGRPRAHGGRMAAAPEAVTAPTGTLTSPGPAHAEEPEDLWPATDPAAGAADEFFDRNAEGAADGEHDAVTRAAAPVLKVLDRASSQRSPPRHLRLRPAALLPQGDLLLDEGFLLWPQVADALAFPELRDAQPFAAFRGLRPKLHFIRTGLDRLPRRPLLFHDEISKKEQPNGTKNGAAWQARTKKSVRKNEGREGGRKETQERQKEWGEFEVSGRRVRVLGVSFVPSD